MGCADACIVCGSYGVSSGFEEGIDGYIVAEKNCQLLVWALNEEKIFRSMEDIFKFYANLFSFMKFSL